MIRRSVPVLTQWTEDGWTAWMRQRTENVPPPRHESNSLRPITSLSELSCSLQNMELKSSSLELTRPALPNTGQACQYHQGRVGEINFVHKSEQVPSPCKLVVSKQIVSRSIYAERGCYNSVCVTHSLLIVFNEPY